MAHQFIKGTDVINYMRWAYGRKPSKAMLSKLSEVIHAQVTLMATRADNKKITTWQPNEDSLRIKFGGKRAVLRCWKCHKKDDSVNMQGQVCKSCKDVSGNK